MNDDLNSYDSIFLTKSLNRKYFSQECRGKKKKRPLYLVKDKKERKEGERNGQGKKKPA